MNQPYVTVKEYLKYWGISNVDEMALKRNILEAQEKIDSVTYNRIVAVGFDNLTKFQREKVKLAMYYQIAYVEENGTEDSSISAYSVLDISITVDKNTKTKAQKLNMSSFALDQLEKTGLCVRNFRWH